MAGGAVEHLEHVGEAELALVVLAHIGQNLVNLLFGELGLGDEVGPQQLLLVYQSVVRLVEYLEGLQIHPLAAVGDYLGGHQLQELAEVDEAVAVGVDVVDNGLEFLLVEALAQRFEDLVEFLGGGGCTRMEMEPEPSWSNSLKAFCAYSSSFLERYLRSECFTLNICSDYIQTQRAYNMPLV